MDLPTGILWIGALIVPGAAYRNAPETAADRLRSGACLMWSVLPRLLAAFIIAGLIQLLIPREFVLRWIGPESGWREIAVASVAGS
jgi:hypothetical protein